MTVLLGTYCEQMGIPAKIELADFKWEDSDNYLSPIKDTPLKSALMGKTNCSMVLISAGTLFWAARSLEEYTDIQPCVQMAEALLCWQADPRYYDKATDWFSKEVDGELYLEDDVTETFVTEAASVFQMAPGRHTAFPNVDDTANLVCLLRHILSKPAKAEYKVWLEGLIKRLDKVAANAHQTFLRRGDFETDDEFKTYIALNMGPPLPPSAANLNVEFDAATAKAQYSTFLKSVDWKSNPFLADPEQMIALGFEGIPYT